MCIFHDITASFTFLMVYSVVSGMTVQQNMASVYRNLHQKCLLWENCGIMQSSVDKWSQVKACPLRSHKPHTTELPDVLPRYTHDAVHRNRKLQYFVSHSLSVKACRFWRDWIKWLQLAIIVKSVFGAHIHSNPLYKLIQWIISPG